MRCKNDENAHYKGTELSPKGLGYAAHPEELLKRKKGLDGNFGIVVSVGSSINSKKRWIPYEQYRQRKIRDKERVLAAEKREKAAKDKILRAEKAAKDKLNNVGNGSKGGNRAPALKAGARLRCVNDGKRYYKSTDNSPLGLGISPYPFEDGKKKKGKDGKWYLVLQRNEKRKTWETIPDYKLFYQKAKDRADKLAARDAKKLESNKLVLDNDGFPTNF